MPWGLKRFQRTRHLHFVTFTCHRRVPLLNTPEAAHTFEETLERVRRWYSFCVSGYVVMPDHVHLLMSEPARSQLSTVIQMLKQIVARKLGGATDDRFWEKRYYDFNVWSESKRIEKLRYMHRNPVKCGLVEKPQDFPWSSFRHYATGAEGIVEIESEWTARQRERIGITLKHTD